VGKQFSQIFTAILIVIMDVVQKINHPIPEVDAICLAASKHGIDNGCIFSGIMVPTE